MIEFQSNQRINNREFHINKSNYNVITVVRSINIDSRETTQSDHTFPPSPVRTYPGASEKHSNSGTLPGDTPNESKGVKSSKARKAFSFKGERVLVLWVAPEHAAEAAFSTRGLQGLWLLRLRCWDTFYGY